MAAVGAEVSDTREISVSRGEGKKSFKERRFATAV